MLNFLSYTLLVGSLPFFEENTSATRVKICNAEYKWPEPESKGPSNEAKGLVESLLVEAQDRSSKEEFVRHPFFIEGYNPWGMYPDSRRMTASARANEGIERDHALGQLYGRLAGVGKDGNGVDWEIVPRDL